MFRRSFFVPAAAVTLALVAWSLGSLPAAAGVPASPAGPSTEAAGSPGTLINIQPGFQPGGTFNVLSATLDFVF